MQCKTTNVTQSIQRNAAMTQDAAISCGQSNSDQRNEKAPTSNQPSSPFQVDTLESQRVLVELEAQGHKQNKIWLINKDK